MKLGKKEKNSAELSSSKIVEDKNFIALRELYTKLKLTYSNLEILNNLEKGEFIPLSIFNKKLSSLEVITKYLVENKNLSLKKISELLNRTNINIWNTYNRSKKKFPRRLVVIESILLPISILRNLNFTLLENIVSYLKDLGLNYHEIAVTLKRDDRTVWTVYQRAKNKRE